MAKTLMQIEIERISSEYWYSNMRLETQLVLICWETYSVNPSVYHPHTIEDARRIAKVKLQFCKQVVLQFWEKGILYSQQSARNNEQAERLGKL